MLSHTSVSSHRLLLPGYISPPFYLEKSNSPFKTRLNYFFLYYQTLFFVLPLVSVCTSLIAFTI